MGIFFSAVYLLFLYLWVADGRTIVHVKRFFALYPTPWGHRRKGISTAEKGSHIYERRHTTCLNTANYEYHLTNCSHNGDTLSLQSYDYFFIISTK